MKRLVIVFCLYSCLFGEEVMATHYMGGEITWECLANGRFRFIMKLYRECSGVNYTDTAMLKSNSPAGNIKMTLKPGGNPKDILDGTLDGKSDLSPDCNGDPNFTHIECATTPVNPYTPNTGAVQEWYYTSDPSYPNGVMLNGVPPFTGWVFSYTSCCRNACNNIIGSTSMSWFIRAIMYPYYNTSAYPCWDNSPVFAELPSTIICSGYPHTYNHNAYDPEFDSLAYEWTQPLNTSISSPINSYAAGYSSTSPLPGTYHNPNNINAVLNPATGQISLLSYTAGAFLTVTKVKAFRCGVKIAEIFREHQLVITSCGTNYPPVLTVDNTTQTGPKMFTDTAFVGDTLVSLIIVTDTTLPILLPNGQLQTVILNAAGKQFGAGFTSDSTGCPFPPCATLTPSPPVAGNIGVAAVLRWRIAMGHLLQETSICSPSIPFYDFLFNIKDDFCPVPGQNGYIYRVYLLGLTYNNWSCINITQQNDVVIGWKEVFDPDSLFDHYILSYSMNAEGPYIPLDTIYNIHHTSWIHSAMNPQNQVIWYKLSAVYKLNTKSYTAAVFNASTIKLNAPSNVGINDTFTLTLSGSINPGDSIVWDFGKATLISGSGAGPYLLRADSIGIITINMQKYDSCGTTYLQKNIMVIGTGYDDHEVNSQQISVRPDYENNSLLVDWSKVTDAQSEMILYDASGRQVLKYRLAKNQKNERIPLPALAEGIYQFVIYSRGTSLAQGKILIR